MNKFIGIFNIGVLLFILPYSWANSPTGSLSETPNQIQYFGYFKSASENARPTDTIAQTSDHTNIDIIEAGADMDFILQKLQEDSQYGKKAIIMAQAPFFIPDPKTTNGLLLNPAYQSDWKTFAAQIAPYIDTIAAFYPLDEPRLRNINAVTLSTIFGAIKATFPKTNTAVTFDTNYPTDPGFVMPSSLDWVGMDCYNSELQTDWWSQCNGIGMEKILDTLQSEMTSGQKMFLVPQGYIDDATFGNLSKRTVAQNALVGETSDFNNYALDHSNIVAVLAFSWADFSDGGNSWDHGAIDLPVLQNAFRQWGSSIVRANISSSIQTLYLNFLGRLPTVLEVSHVSANFQNGVSLYSLQQSITSGAEAKTVIEALYTNLLGRAADPSGVSYNLELLKKGWTLSAIRSQFAYSAEEKTDINNLYLKYLGRSVDTDGLAYIQNLLATSITLTSVVSVIESSREYQDRAYTISLYEKLFNRSGDAAGIAAGTQFLLSGGTQSALRAQFAYSPEEQGYLNVIYESDLGREIDASALAYYEELLAQSETLFQVSQTVLSSPERRDRVYTVNLFNDLLNRSGDASGIAAGTHFLLTGGTEAALRVQFAYSPEEERDINAIYLKHLKRPVDPNGLAYYQNLLSTSWTLNEVASNVEASPEAKNLK